MADVRDVAPLRRELLDRVLRAVRSLGAAETLDDALQRITDDVVRTLDFSAAALSVADPDGELVVRAVAGPDAAQQLVGSRTTTADWDNLFDLSTRSGQLYFLDHTMGEHPAVAAVDSWFEEEVPELPDDVWHPGDTLLAPMHDEAGRLTGVLSADLAAGSVHDFEQRTALELFAAEAGSALLEWEVRTRLDDRRRDAERRWHLAWDSGLIGSAIIDEAGTIVDVNDRGASMLGWEPVELVGRHLLDVVPFETADDAAKRLTDLVSDMSSWIDERALRHRDGHTIWTTMHASTVLEGSPRRPVLIVQFSDSTERHEHEARIAHQLVHDPLTDLPNRRALEERLDDLFERDVPFGVLIGDIDGFKSVADGLGHAAGDELIVAVAARLQAVVGEIGLLVRLAGDEFALCVEGISEPDDLVLLAERMAGALAAPFRLGTHEHVVQISVGVSGTRAWHHHPVDVLREADQALLRAKRRGRGRIELFDPGQDHPVTRADLDLEHELRRVLENGRELEPHFQSVISLVSGAVVGYESLLRWRHPRLGVLLPERFLPIADRAGLTAAIGWRMLDLVRWAVPARNASTVNRPWIAVNVSASQLGRGRLLGALRQLIDATFPSAPSELCLEITETSLLDASPDVVDELYAAADLGVRIALDDFGTGYSSLTLLRDLPVSSIKIDRSFIAPIAVDIRARTIVQHTIELCQGLGMSTVAEGIETHEQLAWLQTLGCEYGQGFLIERPSPWPFPDQPGESDLRRFEP